MRHRDPRAPVLAQLEPSGLFDSYRTDDAKHPGRIVFVHSDRLSQPRLSGVVSAIPTLTEVLRDRSR